MDDEMENDVFNVFAFCVQKMLFSKTVENARFVDKVRVSKNGIIWLQFFPLLGALVLFIIACIVTSAVSRSSHIGAAQPKLSHVAAAPHPQFSSVAAISDVVLKVEGFLPCLEAIKGLKACTVEILKAVFGLPLDASCCQVVKQIVINCSTKGFPLSYAFLPEVLEDCFNAHAPPASG
ncbi:uncharacterized protein Fot_34496 [Forsythia ovata]|uniref:Prolamin-like domain-containing protein n=1 Tax=Forsythia ovata TaxID=205694 RepID=A0ABD1SLQ5_9LAMI